MTFHIGQQVVCVDDGQCHCGKPSALKRGRVYTVTLCRANTVDGELGVTLGEVEPHWPHPGFRASRFAPVCKTDISALTALLNKTPETV